jgi:hypothetical protein
MPDDKKRFILLDDIRDIHKAREFEPALILQTSPKSAQALYVADGKTDEAAARFFFNNFNKGNGDEKISGLIHPMRLAGFTNRKPKYEENGQFPFVKIIEAQGGTSQKCTDFINQIQEEMERRLELTPEITKPKAMPKIAQHDHMKTDDLDMPAVKKWYQEQLEYWDDKADLSKIDRRLAVKMQADGYTASDTKTAILEASPNVRQRHPDIEKYLAGKTAGLDFASEPPQQQRSREMEIER